VHKNATQEGEIMNIKQLSVIMLFCAVTTQLQAASDVIITPAHKADCSKENYRLLNWIANPHKTETESNLQIIFYTKFGKCSQQKDAYYKFSKLNTVAEATFWHEGINTPWDKLPFSYDLELISDTVIKVTIDFDKDKLFSKKDFRKFDYVFTPVHGVDFSWTITLQKNGEGKTILNFIQK
jgi:hypothetical protein